MAYERIRNLREDMDLSQTQVAQVLNCSQRIYSNYERGDVDIPTDILIKLAQFHQTSVGLSPGPDSMSALPTPAARSGQAENFPVAFPDNRVIITPSIKCEVFQ